MVFQNRCRRGVFMQWRIMEDQILCVTNSYIRKFYIDPAFEKLPTVVKQELQIISVKFTEDIGGILMFYFDAEGALKLKVMADDADYLFDEIGADLKIKELSKKHAELFQKLEAFYALVVKKGDVAEYLKKEMAQGAESDGN